MKSGQFYRFLFVGFINTIIGLSTIYLLLFVGFSYWPSTFVGNAAGATCSYFLNRTYTFQNKKAIQETILRFFVVIGVCYLFAYFVGKRTAIWAIEQLSNIPVDYTEELAVLAGTILYTLINFIGQKEFVFNS